MKRVSGISTYICLILLLSAGILADDKKQSVNFDDFDNLDMRTTDSGMVWYASGDLKFIIDSTTILSDSLEWYQEQGIVYFFGNVEAYDSVQHIWANKVSYFNDDSVVFAYGNVVLIQSKDSIRAEAQVVEFNRRDKTVYMENDPWLYLNYPDLKNLVKITADYLVFYNDEQNGMAIDNVIIEHTDTRATCGCAEMFRTDNRLFLMDEPVAIRDSSQITGNYMDIKFGEGKVELIKVFEEAYAYFIEASDSGTGDFAGESNLSGGEITFYFDADEIRKISATGAAQSEYMPASDDTTGAGKNFVSGDSIYIYVENKKISKAEVIGGAEGIYVTERKVKQDPGKRDSLAVGEDAPCDTCTSVILTEEEFREREQMADSGLMADSAAVLDSLLEVANAPVVEDSILYKGQLIEFFAPERIIRITEQANVRQEEVVLNAHTVDYDIPNRLIIASAKIDSTDSLPTIEPLGLKDGGEEIFGTHLIFNVDTKKGLIEDAATLFENTHYRGDDLFKEEEKVFYVEDGVLIPCDKPNPNFHFHAKWMKVIKDERVIARPVTLYIHKLPVAYIPYYVFPLQRGRHSGILPIKLGNFERGNRFFGNLGYYWAASEYWDLEGSLDFYENVSVTLNGLFRYNKRYAYSGYVRGTFTRESEEFAFEDRRSDKWTLSGSHSQTLPFDIKFGATGTYISDKDYYTDYSTNQDERLNRNIRSQASFSKIFGWGSLSLGFTHQDNLDTDSKSSTLPSGRFSVKSFNPFGSGKTVDGKLEKEWYNQFSVSYSSNFSVFMSNNKETADTTYSFTDPTGTVTTISDTTITESKKRFQYLNHSLSVSSPQNILTYFTFTPNVRLWETWYYVPETNLSREAGLDGSKLYRRGAVSAGVSTRTNLYGTFNINKFGLGAIRHVLTPLVGFTWAPDVVKNDDVKAYVGAGGGGSRLMALTMSATNLIQAKIVRNEEEKKLDLLNISSGTSYNFEGTGQKFSDLRTSISSRAIQKINISGSLTHSLYDENDELIWWRPTLNSFTLNSSFQARGSVSDDYTRTGLETGRDYDKEIADTTGGFPSPNLPGERSAETSSKTNWNLNVSHSYSELYSGGSITSRSHFINLTFNVNLTRNWKLKYSQRYDFVKHSTIDKVIDLHRSLNCWEGHFYWIPNGSRKGFYFKVFLIGIPDLKVEKSESGLRGALFNR